MITIPATVNLMKLLDALRSDIASNITTKDYIDIKNDHDQLGLIVDIWDKEDYQLLDTYTYWFDDFKD